MLIVLIQVVEKGKKQTNKTKKNKEKKRIFSFTPLEDKQAGSTAGFLVC